MDIILIISIISAIVGIIGFIIQLLIDQERILNLRQNPEAKKIFTLIILLSIIVAIFDIFILPKSEFINWQPITYQQKETDLSTIGNVRLRQESRTLNFRTTQFETKTLLSDEIFPTTFAIQKAKDRKVYYVGTYGAGLYSSTNLLDWKFIGLDDLVITKIIVDQYYDEKMWAATNLGVAITEDGGNNWEILGPVKDIITDLAYNPDKPNEMLAGTLNGIYYSADGSQTWIGPILEGEVVTSVSYSPSNPNKVYISCLHGAIFRSDNGGMEWKLIRESDDEGSSPIAVDLNNENVVYIAPSDYGIFRTTDGGEEWEYLGLNGVSISSILLSKGSSQIIFVGTDDRKGLFYSVDGGEHWRNNGKLLDEVLSIIEDEGNPGVVLVATLTNGVISSQDFGNSWDALGLSAIKSGTDFDIKELQVWGKNYNYLLSYSYYVHGLFESRDGGYSWTPLPGNSELFKYDIRRLAVDSSDMNHLIISVHGGEVLESFDGGSSWKSITGNLPLDGYAPISFAGDGLLFSGPSNRGVWRKRTGENKWEQSGLGGFSIEHLWVEYGGEIIYALDNKGVLHTSKDLGNNWSDSFMFFHSVAIHPGNYENIVGITESYDVVVSANGGDTWSKRGSLLAITKYEQPYILASNEPGNFYITLGQILLTSSDEGLTWLEHDLPEGGRLGAVSGNSIYYIGDEALYASKTEGEDFQPVRYKTLITSSTKSLQLSNEIYLLGTSSNGIFISYDATESWNQTTLGAGNKVLALEKISEPKDLILALIANDSGVSIASSSDGIVWSVKDTKCKSYPPYYGYFKNIKYQLGSIWKFECSDPVGLMVIKPNENYSEYLIDTQDVSNYSDALFIAEDNVYLLKSSYSEVLVYRTTDLGKKWRPVGYFNGYYQWEFTNDLRSEGILLVKDGGVIAGSLKPEHTQPIITYVALTLFCILCGIVIYKPNISRRLLLDLKRSLSWTFTQAKLGDEKLSGYYALLIFPTLLVITILFYQMVPQSTIISSLIVEHNLNNLVYLFERKLSQAQFNLFTRDGSLLVSVFLSYFCIIITTTFILIAVGSNKVEDKPDYVKKFTSLYIDTFVSSLSVFITSFSLLCFIGVIISSNIHVIEQTFLGIPTKRWVSLIAIALFYKIMSVAIIRVVDYTHIKIKKLTLSFVVATVVISLVSELFLKMIISTFPGKFTSALGTIPIISFGFASIFLMILFTMLNPSIQKS